MQAPGVMTSALQPPPWEQKHEQLQLQKDILLTLMEEIRSALVQRLQQDDQALLARLSPDPLEPLVTGYGLLPAIQENDPLIAVQPRQTFYSLKWVEDRLNDELAKAEKQNGQLAGSAVLDSEALVSEFEQSLEQLRSLEEHLVYHQQWQNAVIQYPEYFAKKNKLVVLVRELDTAMRNEDSPQRVSALRRQLVQNVAPFRTTSGIALVNIEGGGKRLPITICTDIEDPDFLQAFQSSVQDAFSNSLAARARQFSVNLEWHLIRADTLYPNGPPDHGAAIDLDTHLSLFAGCRLVLTTGGSSTKARVGTYIVLGSDPLSRRTLAHEFGHLLGFEDAYVRGYDGDPGDPYGVVLVEWSGLTDNLMGNPEGGQVSNEMIENLITAYSVPTVR